MKDRHRGQPNLIAALAALVPTLVHQLIGFSMATSGTSEPVRPTTSCQIPLAGFLRGKFRLKLPQRLRKGRSGHASTLPVVAC
jgi:hypothetical protein